MLRHGLGAKKDPAEALIWLLVAEARGHTGARHSIAALRKSLPPDAVVEAAAKAWLTENFGKKFQ